MHPSRVRRIGRRGRTPSWPPCYAAPAAKSTCATRPGAPVVFRLSHGGVQPATSAGAVDRPSPRDLDSAHLHLNPLVPASPSAYIGQPRLVAGRGQADPGPVRDTQIESCSRIPPRTRVQASPGPESAQSGAKPPIAACTARSTSTALPPARSPAGTEFLVGTSVLDSR